MTKCILSSGINWYYLNIVIKTKQNHLHCRRCITFSTVPHSTTHSVCIILCQLLWGVHVFLYCICVFCFFFFKFWHLSPLANPGCLTNSALRFIFPSMLILLPSKHVAQNSVNALFLLSATLQTCLVLCKCYNNSAVQLFQYILQASVRVASVPHTRQQQP